MGALDESKHKSEIIPQVRSCTPASTEQVHVRATCGEKVFADSSPQYPVGSAVEYLSSSKGYWVMATVLGFHASSGLYDLDCKTHVEPQRIRWHFRIASGGGSDFIVPNVDATGNAHSNEPCLQRVSDAARPVSCFAVGSLVEYLSITQGVWIQTKVLKFHVAS